MENLTAREAFLLNSLARTAGYTDERMAEVLTSYIRNRGKTLAECIHAEVARM